MYALTLFGQDLRQAVRSLMRSQGLSLTVIITLALGIGANAAIFSLVRGVLLRPLVNADENHLVYVRQSATFGKGMENARFSVPDILDLKASVKSSPAEISTTSTAKARSASSSSVTASPSGCSQGRCRQSPCLLDGPCAAIHSRV